VFCINGLPSLGRRATRFTGRDRVLQGSSAMPQWPFADKTDISYRLIGMSCGIGAS
jgi:hypothetical protein